jgi:hypothetical protein
MMSVLVDPRSWDDLIGTKHFAQALNDTVAQFIDNHRRRNPPYRSAPGLLELDR